MRSYRGAKHSLAARLLWLYIGMSVLFVVLVGGLIAMGFKQNFQESIRPHLLQYLQYLQTDIGYPPDFQRAKALADQLSIEIFIQDPQRNWSSSDTKIDISEIHFYRKYSDRGIIYQTGDRDDREYLIVKHPNYTLGFSIESHNRRVGAGHIIIVSILLSLLVIFYHATRRIFQPIETIERGIQKIGDGDLRHRIQISREDELGKLADSINRMATDIQEMLEAKRQLLLAISHELRSPITRAKVAVAMLTDERQRLEIDKDLNEVDQLIEELLETERLSSQHRVLNLYPIDLISLANELIKEHFTEHTIDLRHKKKSIKIAVDPARIKLLLKNLIDNALRYNAIDALPVQVHIDHSDEAVTIVVKDFGEGVDAEHLPHLLEPFYRADASRRRETGGYGLGLYLCQRIAMAHGGQLSIESEVKRGTKVTIVLPRFVR